MLLLPLLVSVQLTRLSSPFCNFSDNRFVILMPAVAESLPCFL